MGVRLRDRVLAVALPDAPSRQFWTTLILVSVALRAFVALVLLGSMPIYSDALAYSQQADHILHPVHGPDPYYWPPGTSYLLVPFYWLLGVHDWVARVAMIGVSVGAVVTTALLALRVLRDNRAALLAGWVLALYPAMWIEAAQPFSFDVTLLFVNLTGLFALRGWQDRRLWPYALAGLALGAAGLTRPSTLILGVALVALGIVALIRRRREGQPNEWPRLALGTALAVACAAVVLAPAVVHNEADDQGLTVSVNNEQNIWIGNNPYTPVYTTDRIGQHPVEDFPDYQRAYLSKYIYGGHPTRAQRSADLNEAERFVENHPAISLLRTANRARAFWGFDYTIPNLFRTNWGKGAATEAVGLLFDIGGYLLLIVLMIIGLVFARGLFRSGTLWFVVVLIAAFELPYMLSYAAGRWHYPTLGLLAIPAGAGAAWLMSTPDRWRRLWTSKPFWIATAAFVVLQVEFSYFTITSR
jgi:4-amino-4-deoxy-L-arabinose transferase-like glycosyltransferase